MHDAENRQSEINRAAAKLAREVSDKAPRPFSLQARLGQRVSFLRRWGHLILSRGERYFVLRLKRWSKAGCICSGSKRYPARKSYALPSRAQQALAYRLSPHFPLIATGGP